MNDFIHRFQKQTNGEKPAAPTAIEEFRAERAEVSEGLGAIRMLLAEMLRELKQQSTPSSREPYVAPFPKTPETPEMTEEERRAERDRMANEYLASGGPL